MEVETLVAELRNVDNGFARSLVKFHDDKGFLTGKQRAAAEKMLARKNGKVFAEKGKDNMRLSNAQRSAIRKLITGHARWSEYKRAHAITTADLDRKGSGYTTAGVAEDLMIDIRGTENSIEETTMPETTQAFFDETETPRVPETADMSEYVKRSQYDPTIQGLASDIYALEKDNGNLNSVIKALSEALEAVETRTPRVLKIQTGDNAPVTVEGLQHEAFDKLLKLCSARDVSGNRLNVWIYGPAGSGKSHSARQVADALGMDFYAHGAMEMDFQLLGFVNQVSGEYVDTPFVRGFRNGGVVLLDEIDAWDANATLALNGATANGEVWLPNGERVVRHPDCVIVGGANTKGAGPTSDYVGRNKLDGAFMSRFAAKLFWGYDFNLELALSGNEAFTKRVQKARSKAALYGVDVMITPRHSIAGAALVAVGFTMDEAAELTYLADLTDEQRDILKDG